MNGILHILDQAGTGLMQLQQENETLRQRVATLERELASPAGQYQEAGRESDG